MKFIISLIGIIFFTMTVTAHAEIISLEDVVKRVSSQNYEVLGDALKVYQAKQSVNVARGELLPSLNIWKIVGAVLDPVSLISQDIAPFLVPANWFKLEQAKILYLAEKEGYRALWANEVFSAKGLYYQILSDQNLYRLIGQVRDRTAELETVAVKRERLGGIKPGIARELKMRRLALEEDLLRLNHLVEEERRLFVYHLGFNWGAQVVLAPIKLPNLFEEERLNDKDLEWRLVSTSPERRQHLHFIDALQYIVGEIRYSFLGLSSNNRGVAGGIFDHLPIPSGLGFATAPSVEIAKAEEQKLGFQLKGIEETLKRELSSMTSQFNLELDAYPTLTDRVNLSREAMDALEKRLIFGEDVDLVLLGENYKAYVTAESALLQAQYRFLVFRERLMRLTFNEDYNLTPAVLEEIKK